MDILPEKLSRYSSLIPEYDAFAQSLFEQLPIYIRVNTLKTSTSAVESFLEHENINYSKSPIEWFYQIDFQHKLRLSPAYHLGHIYHQTLSSSIAAHGLDISPGLSVLDLCAAPGGKTTHVSQLMEDTGFIVANDRTRHRLTALMSNLKRLGITNCVVTSGRGEHFPYGQKFDRVLVDAPCSGEGKWRMSMDNGIENMRVGNTDLPAIQKGLLARGFEMLAPDGILVYSTCTYNPEENEGVVSHLLRKRRAKLTEFNPQLPFSEGITRFMERKYDESCKLCRRFYPHKTGSGGFFLARITHQ